MSIQISPETEALLSDEARRRGISVDALLEQLLRERAPSSAGMVPGRKIPELPVLHLGVMGSLHRRDIYDDVR